MNVNAPLHAIHWLSVMMDASSKHNPTVGPTPISSGAPHVHHVYSVSAIRTALSPYPALASDLDACFAAWIAAHRVPFIHGCMAANPALAITGLSRASVVTLLSGLIRNANNNNNNNNKNSSSSSSSSSSSRRPQTPPSRLPSPNSLLSGIPYDQVLVDPSNLEHTEAFFFPDYPSLLAHLRAQTYANKKIVQARKRQATLDAATADFNAARTMVHPGHWPLDRPPQPLTERCPQSSSGPTAILRPWATASNLAVHAMLLDLDFTHSVLRLVALDLEAYEFDHRKITEVGYTIADIVPWTALRNERIPLAPGDHWIALPNSAFHRPRNPVPPPPLSSSHQQPPCYSSQSLTYDTLPHMITPPRSPPDDDHLDDHDHHLLHQDQQSHDWVLLVRPRHIVVSEFIALHNGVRVPDAKFAFLGTSATLPLTVAMSHLSNIMHGADAVVGHALQSDVQFLRKGCPDVRVHLPTCVFDTQVIFKAITNSLDMVRLSRVLDAVGVEYDAARLHNAGNDAVFSLYALLRLVGVGEMVPSTSLQVVLAEERRGDMEDEGGAGSGPISLDVMMDEG